MEGLTIGQQLTQIQEAMCDKYCKFPERYQITPEMSIEEADAMLDKLNEEICAECPMCKL